MTAEAAKKNNPSLQKRTAARMAAAQCLYKLAMGGERLSPAQQVVILKKQLANNREEQKLQVGAAVEPNYKMVQSLLEGIIQRRPDIEMRMTGMLSVEWTRDRMSPLLIAILECAIFELFFDKPISPKIVIDEYTRLTRCFFSEGEVNFVHAALTKLSQKYG